ncbi:dUTP diphosphatase [bacterium]|jgi:dUTP pyrophosphatase|nr:dUTP diphosphatase [bacterium]
MNVYKVNENAELPAYATDGSACFDIKACFKRGDKLLAYNNWNKETHVAVKGVGRVADAFQIPPDTRVLIPTGLVFDIPENHVMKMYVRSGVALKKGLTLANNVGIIDSDYVEQTFIMMINQTDSLVMIENGERLAQCLIEKTTKIEINETAEPIVSKTDRDGGFGSTGD